MFCDILTALGGSFAGKLSCGGFPIATISFPNMVQEFLVFFMGPGTMSFDHIGSFTSLESNEGARCIITGKISYALNDIV